MPKNVLIVSYIFPPKSGIGGRRWAKFSKYLNRMDIDLKVLTFQKKNDSNFSNWSKDIVEYENKIERIKPIQPYYLKNNAPKTIIGKIKYHISLLYWKNTYNGNYYDETVAMQSQIFGLLEKYYLQGYNNIIITSAPFSLSYFGALFKEKYPQCNLITDFRDPWTNNETTYQYRFLSSKRLDYEKNIEKLTINQSNIVYTVNQTMANYFSGLKTNQDVNIKVLNNGFDSEDFAPIAKTTKRYSNKIQFIYAGTIYEETEYVLDPFFEAVNQLSVLPDIQDKVSFNFYCDINNKFKSKIINCNIVKMFEPVPLSEIHQIIEANDVCMLFLTKDLKDSFSTKFYEYVFHKKFIVVFSEKGETGNFVEEKHLGLHICPQDIYKKLYDIIANPDCVKFNKEFNSSIFEVGNIAKNINTDLI